MLSKPATWLLHIALATIVAGACVTHFFGEQGEVHLRFNEAASLTTRHSTLTLFLWNFNVVSDGGTSVDFVSELRLMERTEGADKLQVDEGTVRINKPLKYRNYRFCQSDYDSDRQGVVLAYNYDPWGIGITYTGYALLLLAMIAFFFQRLTCFRALLRRQHWILMLVLGVVIVVLAVVMTRVVTPKPPLQPVLQTPLLGIHVSVIMLAYTLFAVIMVNGVLGLCLPKRRESLMQLSRVLLYPAVFCLTAGIFIGAVWANMSWGRYWGWDPKETWALITMLVYALPLHTQAIAWLRRPLVFHVYMAAAFLFVLFTYFGVNHFLGGLHSYA